MSQSLSKTGSKTHLKMKAALCAIILTLGLTSASAKDFECPSDYGWYADPENCIRYFHCSVGVAQEYLCGISKLVASPRRFLH